MTFSIAARDTASGTVGISVASRFFACGAKVPYVSARSVFASQAFINPLWGLDGLPRLDSGEAPEEVLATLREQDLGQSNRQAHMIGPDGRIAQHTGVNCVPWAGHCKAENVSIAGNMLAGPAVIEAMLDAWQSAPDQPLAERLLTAMEAGESAGGDKRGRQSAALLVVRAKGGYAGLNDRFIDIRVEDHKTPVKELGRLLALHKKFYTRAHRNKPKREPAAP